MSTYYSPELARLLVNERLREASRARMVRAGEQNRVERANLVEGPKRFILDLVRHQVRAACGC